LLNRGDGSFAAKRDYRTGYPFSLAIGDLNGDGKPDLVTANDDADNTVSVLLNTPDLSVPPSREYQTLRGAKSTRARDQNGDGRPDLATANSFPSNTVSVLINTPGLCAAQDVEGMTLPAAKRTIARAHCRVGKIRRAYSKEGLKGLVISQRPKPGTVLPNR